ncbi:CBS domain-containing protein [Streptomyces sp. NPDC012637]|uniref:CBS domain-containing protein n=1 Tax=Streptomyces sp. NPDC012637 TaxID=3364842 RepID=UPI0036F14E0E
MTHDVVTAAPATSFKEIAHLLAERDVSAVPVIDEDRRLLGIVSRATLLRPFLRTASSPRSPSV